jgi:uncharacterized protein (UPF0332 family)
MVRKLKRLDFEDCMREGLLRRTPPSRGRAESSLRAADRWLEEADISLRNGAFNASVLSAYLAMFHSARAVLILEGYRERSHYCIARYLEEKYVKKGLLEGKWVELLDHHRELRHTSQYNVNFITSESEAHNTLRTAKRFVKRMKTLISDIK